MNGLFAFYLFNKMVRFAVFGISNEKKREVLYPSIAVIYIIFKHNL